jgi:tetratricopeptide (TPR) repeat protein
VTALAGATALTGEFPLSARFVGRRAPLERLRALAATCVSAPEATFVTLTGAAGIGKTRLAQEFGRVVRAAHAGARVLAATCGGSGDARPYAGFARVLATRFGIDDADSAAQAQHKILGVCAEVLGEPASIEVTHLVAQMVGVAFAGSAVVGPLAETPAQLEGRMFIAVRRFLAADARTAPIFLVLDEVERAAPETVNLIHYLAAGLGAHPVLLLCVARPQVFDVHPAFGEGDFDAQRIELGPLPHGEATTLLGALLAPAGEAPAELAQKVRTGLGGSPRAMVDLVRLLVDAEVIEPVLAAAEPTVRTTLSETAVPTPPLSTPTPGFRFEPAALRAFLGAMPLSHDEILSERLRLLPAGERDLLDRAAVCGERFWLDAVVALVRAAALETAGPDGPTLTEIAGAGDRTRQAAAASLARLERAGWVQESSHPQIPGEREWRFAYQPLQEIIYGGVAERPRRSYHRLLAQWLELRPHGRDEEAQEEVGRHLEQAGDGEAAATRYRRAADAARTRYFNDQAIRLYAQALECLGREDLASRIHLWHDLGSVYALRGDSDAALGAFERMLRLAWVAASRVKGAVALNKMGRVWRDKGDLQLALEYLERGRELFEQAGDRRGVAASQDDLGQALWMLGRYDAALDQSAAALEERRRLGDRRSVAASLSNIGMIEKDRGLFEEADSCHREALAIRREIGDRAGETKSRQNLGILAAERGDLASARREWEQALKISNDIGSLPMAARLLNNLGEAAVAAGNVPEARRSLEEALAIARELGEKRLLTDALRNLGLCELLAGRPKLARALCQEALELARAAQLRDFEGRALLALGEVCAATLFDDATAGAACPAEAEAEEYFSRGIELYRQLGNEAELARGLERLGRYRVERGEVEAAKPPLAEARAIFERLGVSTARVQEIVDGLE